MRRLSVKGIIGYLVSIISLVLCLYITIEVICANNDNRPPSIFGLSVSYVPTDSMEDTINPGDYILFNKVSFDDINSGDIIIYRSNNDGRFIVHRVVEVNEDYLIVKGDNNPIPDSEHVTGDMVYGRYIRTLGFMSIFTGGINKNLIFFILIIIFIIMLIMQGVSIYIKSKTEKLKKSREEEMNLIKEELRQEILKEELMKLRNKNNSNKEDK